MQKIIPWSIFALILAISLSGCAALAGKTTPTPTPTASASSSRSQGANHSPSAKISLLKTWRVGDVSFTGPNWNASQIATPYLSLLAQANNNLILEQNTDAWITVEVGPKQSNQETTQLSNLLLLTSGSISNGPIVVPGSGGHNVDEYNITFNSPNFSDSSALVGYWYTSKATVSAICVWDQDTNGLSMQSACHEIFNSLKS